MKSKKSRSKPSGKRGLKNLPPKKTSDVKGGFAAVEHVSITTSTPTPTPARNYRSGPGGAF